MKTVFQVTLFLFVLLLQSVGLHAQSPEAFSYQAVLRDAGTNAPLPNQAVAIRISILAGGPAGTVAYRESHNVSTSAIGLITLSVGGGTPLSGVFDDIDWGTANHFLQVEVDQAGGSSWQPFGVSQLLSVPYALYAKEAGNSLEAGPGITITDGVIINNRPSPWERENEVVFVEDESVGIGIEGTEDVPADTRLFVGGNLRLLDDANIFGVDQIVGFDDLRFAGNPQRSNDVIIGNSGRVTFAEEVGINQTFSFIDLNVRNQPGNSTVFQLEDSTGVDLFEVGRDGNVGINQITSNVTLQVQNKTNGTNNIIANFEKSDGGNVFQVQADNDVVVTGDFSVNNGNKNFILDHPLDPANKVLAHNAVESPDHVTYYHGTVTVDANGEATVELPHYFEALNADYHYQLTCIGGFAQVYVSREISNNRFVIAGGNPGMKVSWQVSARRNDPWAADHPYEAEFDKDPWDKGKYYYPEGYGQPKALQIGMEDGTREATEKEEE